MHNNFYFLRHLSNALKATLQPSVISECFTQNREELIIRFETTSGSFFIKASLLSNFSCLSFLNNFHRAKKNSVDLFESLIGQNVAEIRQFENERSFALELTNGFTLLFKMHGNRSNVILLENGLVKELFKNNSPADLNLDINQLDRVIDWSYDTFLQHHEDPAKLYFTFGKIVWHHLKTLGYNRKSVAEKWGLIQNIKHELEGNNFYLVSFEKAPALSMIKTGSVQKQYTDPVKAINDFYYTFTQIFAFAQEKNTIVAALQAELQSSKNYYKKTFAKLIELEQDTNYKVWADLIMANLHQIPAGAEKITVNNFYNDDHPIEIKLKKDRTAQKNAEIFYKKSKNQKIETEHLQRAIQQKEKEISITESKLLSVKNIEDLKTLRQIKAELGISQAVAKESSPLPYHEFIHNGYKIWVGRNAQSNDVLTLKFGYKEDLWLHAKDVAGSHVLIKHQAGKNFPKDVIERAAQLAAYNSKRKNESLCPVSFTPKKFVRKRKGDPAGAVIVEREDVIMVEPRL